MQLPGFIDLTLVLGSTLQRLAQTWVRMVVPVSLLAQLADHANLNENRTTVGAAQQ